MVDFGKVLAERRDCPHIEIVYKPEHDNFYCTKCKKGMGNKYYQEHIRAVKKS